MRALLVIPMLIGLLWPVVVLADITGKPRIIDGDTLEIAGERIRLHGIDAPESGQCALRTESAGIVAWKPHRP